MKKFNKYLLLLAVAVFAFTACEQEKKREPSPIFGTDVVAFTESKIETEVNPGKAKLEYSLTVARSSADSALTVGINVVEGDSAIIKVPASVSLAKGEKEATVLLTFPNAELDSTYSIVLEIASKNQSPYLEGVSKCSFTVTIATWEPAKTKAIVFDGLVGSMYGVEQYGWYVTYKEKINADGTFDVRLLNPYASYATGDGDKFGIFDGYPYNAASEVLKGEYNWELHVATDGSVTFAPFKMGMLWNEDYGEFSAGLTDGKVGVYDETTKCITFAPGFCWATMANLTKTYTWDEEAVIIYLDATIYQNAHLSIDDYNDPSITWIEQESVVNLFESTIFNFSNDAQKLFAAKDQYPDNPASPFKNLYGLKDVYSEGATLAFYWDGQDGALKIPTPQDTKISFMGQELIIAAAAGNVATATVKGTEVTIFTFQLQVVSDKGNEVGVFTETFSMSDEAIVFEKSDFIGNFVLSGSDPWDGSAIAQNVTITEEEGELYMSNVHAYASPVLCDFDSVTGVLSIASQDLDSLYGKYDIYLVTNDKNDGPIELAFGLNGVAKVTATSAATGFYIASNAAGGALFGIADVTLTPSEATAAPAPAKVRAEQLVGRELGQLASKATNTPSVEHLSFKGKYNRSQLNAEPKF